jgi:hypothetical protein
VFSCILFWLPLNSKYTSAVDHYCEQNLGPKADAPFVHLVDLQKTASSIAMQESSPAQVTVSADAMEYIIQGNRFRMISFREGMRKLFNNTQQLINTIVMGKTYSVSIPEHVVDDITNETRGYSWLDNGQFTEG